MLNDLSFDSSNYSIKKNEGKETFESFNQKYIFEETNKKHKRIKEKILVLDGLFSRQGILRRAEANFLKSFEKKPTKIQQNNKTKNDTIYKSIKDMMELWKGITTRTDINSYLLKNYITDNKEYLIFKDISDTTRPDFFEDSIQSYKKQLPLINKKINPRNVVDQIKALMGKNNKKVFTTELSDIDEKNNSHLHDNKKNAEQSINQGDKNNHGNFGNFKGRILLKKITEVNIGPEILPKSNRSPDKKAIAEYTRRMKKLLPFK